MTQKRYLVTGGCGFIGRNLVSFLRGEGIVNRNIKIVDNFSTGTLDDIAAVTPISMDDKGSEDAVTVYNADIRDTDAMMSLVKNVDCVIHLAACTGLLPAIKDPVFDCETNVRGVLNVLEACRHNKVKRFVFASSNAPLGEIEPPVHELLPVKPMSPYGASKLAGEGYCSAYYHTYGVETSALRFGNVFGPYSEHKGSVVAAFINHALKGLPLPVEGGGTATRDFIYSEDLARALFLASEANEIHGDVIQVSSGTECSISEMLTILLKLFEKFRIDVSIAEMPARAVDITRSFADTTKANKQLNWRTRYSLEEGLQKTLEWFVEQNTSCKKVG